MRGPEPAGPSERADGRAAGSRRSGWARATRGWGVAWLSILIAACQPTATPAANPTATPAPPTRTPPPPATPIPTPRVVADEPGAALSQHRGRFFAAAGACVLCHQVMFDDAGNDMSIASHWRASTMANSARDPYWQAAVWREVAGRPEQAAEIEALCAACHMPMASFTDRAQGAQPRILEGGYLDPAHELHELAMDGVSCTLCHQIRDEGLGFPDSYNGGFRIDTELEPGRRVVFGPYTIEPDQATIMEEASGYVPTQGLHQATSELCATCHTFFVPGSDFPLQTTYLEWYYSDHRRRDTCQDCHMTEAEGGVRIADSSPFPRSPFARHTFEGGNVYLLGMFAEAVSELGLTASAAEFEASRQRSLDFLSSQSVALQLEEVRLSGSRLTVDVAIDNRSGHKFPTGFPSRRAWIRFWVEDSAGQIVFESGGYDAGGSIAGNDNDVDPTTFEQHYLAIVQPEQVQIYETILEQAGGGPGTNLLGAVRYLKDNRLLPSGYDPLRAVESIQVRGGAREDPDFVAGEDRIQYSMDLGSAAGPFTVGVELLYQSIAPSWIAGLAGLDQEPVLRFLALTERVPNLPVVVARQTVTVGE